MLLGGQDLQSVGNKVDSYRTVGRLVSSGVHSRVAPDEIILEWWERHRVSTLSYSRSVGKFYSKTCLFSKVIKCV
jgi:hypothetical protein